MKLHYYPETDSLYIDLIDAESAESQEICPGVALDFDAQRRLVGIDLDDASDHVGLSTLEIEDLPARIAFRAGDAA